MAFTYESRHRGPVIDDAIDTVLENEETWNNKQDKLHGLPGKVAGFDENGNLIAIDMQEGGVTSFNSRKGDIMPQGGKISILGEGGLILQSSDGIEWKWTSVIQTSNNVSNWALIAYGNKMFIAISYNSNKAAYSSDCINWTETTLPYTGYWSGLTFGNGKFVAISDDMDGNGTTKAAYSEDGITWYASTLPVAALWSAVTYGNEIFVAVATESANAAYSFDGVTWTASTLPVSEFWSSITYGNGKFLAKGKGKVAYSNYGTTWTPANLPALPLSTNWMGISYGNGKFITISRNGNQIAYSSDGVNWLETYLPVSAAWAILAYANGKFIAVSDAIGKKVVCSSNGIDWDLAALTYSRNWMSATYSDGDYTAAMVGALPASTEIPKRTSQLENDSNFATISYVDERISSGGSSGAGVPDGGMTGQILAKASDTDKDVVWIDPPTIPQNIVTSFNGRTGAVAPQIGDYTSSMVGALPSSTTVPTLTSQLTNNSGFITSTEMNNAIQSAILDSWGASY